MALDDEDVTFKTFDLQSPRLPLAANSPASSPCPSSSSSSFASNAFKNVVRTGRTARNGRGRRSSSGGGGGGGGLKSTACQEEVDQLMDHSIEIDSNKKMRNEHVSPWTLRFRDEHLETNVTPQSTF